MQPSTEMEDASYNNRVNGGYELHDKGSVRETVKVLSDDDANEVGLPMLTELRTSRSSLPPPPSHWPDLLGTLVQQPSWELLFDVYDSFLMAISIVLIVKTSLCIYAYNKDKGFRGNYLDSVSDLTLQLIRFNDQVITAFTIIFVTIVTTVTRRYALYKAQEGAYIADLEQLQASISLPSTIKIVFSLQKYTRFSVGLVILWSFYYLGSQASKREYTLTMSDRFHTMDTIYPKSDFLTDLITWPVQSPRKLERAFTTTMAEAQDNTAPHDLGVDDNGYVLLPDPAILYMVYPNGTVNNTHGINIRPSGTYYLTAAGRPLLVKNESTAVDPGNGSTVPWIDWLDNRVVGDYKLHTSYFKFHCHSLDVFSLDRFPASVLDTRVSSLNITDTNSTRPADSTSPQQLEYWQRWSVDDLLYVTTDGSMPPAPDVDGSGGGAIRITCDIYEPQVTLGVHCSATACLVTSMICPEVDPATLRTTMFDDPTFAAPFFSDMLLSEGVPESRASNLNLEVTGYLRLQDSTIAFAGNGTLNSTDLQAALDFQTRVLEASVNTYLNLAEQQIYPSSTTDSSPDGFVTVTFMGNFYDPHFALFWEWIAIDYLSGALLLAAAVASFWLRKHTLVPDIFGFVSSLTRDNPHFPVPVGASTLDGLARARAFRDFKVKIGDVGGLDGEHGRIGFIPVDPDIPTEKLSKHRKYL